MKHMQIFDNFSKKKELLLLLDKAVDKKLISTLEDYALDAIDKEYKIKIAAFTGGPGYAYLIYDIDMNVINFRLSDEQIELSDIKDMYNMYKKHGIVYRIEIYTFQENNDASNIINSVMNRMIRHYKTIKILNAQYDNVKYGSPNEERYNKFNLNDDVITTNIDCYFSV